MRTFKAILAAGLLAGMPAAANAQWYVGADVGANFAQDSDVSGSTTNLDTGFDTGWVGLGQVGYAYGGGPKVEFELGYRSNDVDSVGGRSANGDLSATSAMINGIYEFLPQSAFHPFIGAGIGWAWVEADNVTQSGTSTRWSGDDNQFAYQGIAGVAYDVTTDVAIKAQYRYFATLDLDATNSANQAIEAEYANHSVLVGLTYKFNTPAPAPVAAVAAPAPTPAPAPAPVPPAKKSIVARTYMVFFDWNKADIKPEAAAIVSQAAKAAKAGERSRVNLTGHADRSGPDKYNMALSLKRANNVKAELVKQGVPADQIAVVAKGESEPLVATADGVREPQNRRVEIVLP